MAGCGTGEVLSGTVTDVVKGGVLAVTEGVKVFIPASLSGVSKNDSLDQLLKQKVDFVIREVNEKRHRAVGSIKDVLKEQKKALEEKFWSEVEVGKRYQGVVKSLTSYGAFVDLGGVDGMVHISELSWLRINILPTLLKLATCWMFMSRTSTPRTRRSPWATRRPRTTLGKCSREITRSATLSPLGCFDDRFRRLRSDHPGR